MTCKKRNFCDWFNLVACIWICSDLLMNAFCLRNLKIFVPDAVIMGNAATLTCQYDLEKATLYSVRWHFEGEEFYRFVPKESPPAIIFLVSGISVDLDESDGNSVTLRSVTRELTGTFYCEVSEDAPFFHTAIRQARMQVVELPRDDPTMQMGSNLISTAENMKAHCNVGRSFPSANITWFINGRKVYKTPYQRITYRTYEASGTSSNLDLNPQSQILQTVFNSVAMLQNSFDVLCEVSILNVYHKSIQKRIVFTTAPNSTVPPNLLGLDGSKRGRGVGGGNPDNSPLTSGVSPGRLAMANTTNLSTVMAVRLFVILYSFHRANSL